MLSAREVKRQEGQTWCASVQHGKRGELQRRPLPAIPPAADATQDGHGLKTEPASPLEENSGYEPIGCGIIKPYCKPASADPVYATIDRKDSPDTTGAAEEEDRQKPPDGSVDTRRQTKKKEKKKARFDNGAMFLVENLHRQRENVSVWSSERRGEGSRLGRYFSRQINSNYLCRGRQSRDWSWWPFAHSRAMKYGAAVDDGGCFTNHVASLIDSATSDPSPSVLQGQHCRTLHHAAIDMPQGGDSRLKGDRDICLAEEREQALKTGSRSDCGGFIKTDNTVIELSVNYAQDGKSMRTPSRKTDHLPSLGGLLQKGHRHFLTGAAPSSRQVQSGTDHPSPLNTNINNLSAKYYLKDCSQNELSAAPKSGKRSLTKPSLEDAHAASAVPTDSEPQPACAVGISRHDYEEFELCRMKAEMLTGSDARAVSKVSSSPHDSAPCSAVRGKKSVLGFQGREWVRICKWCNVKVCTAACGFTLIAVLLVTVFSQAGVQ